MRLWRLLPMLGPTQNLRFQARTLPVFGIGFGQQLLAHSPPPLPSAWDFFIFSLNWRRRSGVHSMIHPFVLNNASISRMQRI
jgi:hypothetical protein